MNELNNTNYLTLNMADGNEIKRELRFDLIAN